MKSKKSGYKLVTLVFIIWLITLGIFLFSWRNEISVYLNNEIQQSTPTLGNIPDIKPNSENSIDLDLLNQMEFKRLKKNTYSLPSFLSGRKNPFLPIGGEDSQNLE